MCEWVETKHFIERSVSLSPDALHVIAGVMMQVAAALLLRKPLTSWWPWLVVLVFTSSNEIIDLWFERWPSSGMQLGEGFKDLLLTMLLPTMLLLASRRFPRHFEPSSSTSTETVDRL